MAAAGVAVGVDVSERRGLDVVVLAADRTLPAPPQSRRSPDQLADLLEALRPVAVGIDSPPCWGVRGSSRQAERDLAALGVSCFRTPSDPALRDHPFYGWMRAGHEAFAAAARAGYPVYTGGPSVAGCALEVFPHAVAVAVSGHSPPVGTARRRGAMRRWRVGVLEANGVDTSALGTLDAVDAALAALAALVAAEGRFFALGMPEDGLMVLPGERPPQRWPRIGPAR
jgi:predicted nuclease with RNAse H fold